ncbi:MAG: protein translocase subunit SecDF [Dysgonamonadaceae bacterium]|jgi:SecD/SecF fusion protein|nr:protein translocase subunit SecDF [Dysgonamonadaceae bacterium]
MQNKGFITVFSAALLLVCAYYLSFTFVTRHYANLAEVYADGDLSKESYYLDSIATDTVWLNYTLKECRDKEISLGLDLKGGMNVVLEVNVADVLRSLSGQSSDVKFNQALDYASARQSAGDRKDFVSIFVEEYQKLEPGGRLSVLFTPRELNNSDAKVIDYIRTELKSAIDNSFNILRARIDRFGVVAPNIQKLETDGRILVELPGIKEPARVRKLLQGSANLEFWETFELSEIYYQLETANTAIREYNNAHQTDTISSQTGTDLAGTAVAALTTDTATTVSEADKLFAEISKTADSTEIVKQDEAEWRKNYPLFSVLAINQYQGSIIPGPVVGVAHYRDTATVNKYLALTQVKDLLPRNLVFRWSVKSSDAKDQYYQLVALKAVNLRGKSKPSLEGNVIKDAVADFAPNSSKYEVSMSMNSEGAKKWALLTKENIKRCIAIVLDDQVYSFPTVQNEISGGRSSITGNFTPEEGKDLANVLKTGKMPATIHIVQEEVIGPSLGEEAINDGVISFVLAAVILMLYMCFVYGFIAGMIANIALLVNLFFTLGALAAFGAALTLSGIAGLVLSVAISVDANVLIYERIREELRAGKNIKKAVSDGYNNAFSAIFDANLTSIITGLILFWFGTGPIKGFATTLIMGIIASFITAVFMTRIIFEFFLNKGKLQHLTFSTGFMKNFLVSTKINFLGMRKKGYIVIVALLLIGIVGYFAFGLNPGIDFTGGRNYVVRFNKPVETEQVKTSLSETLEGQLNVITIGSNNQVRISTNHGIRNEHPEIDQEIETRLYEGLQSYLDGVTQEEFIASNVKSSQKVGPTVAEDIKVAAIWAVILSMICMALYILLRFRDLAFSIGTLASVAHDSLFIILTYAVFWKIMPFSMEIDQSFIAAILTVIGYSINDTVVIFDRIREVATIYPKRSKFRIINDALNTTLSRTFNTSFSTMLVIICIFVLGGTTIRSFTFAMLVGVIIGIFSTLFIAAPVAYDVIKYKLKKKGITNDEGRDADGE